MTRHIIRIFLWEQTWPVWPSGLRITPRRGKFTYTSPAGYYQYSAISALTGRDQIVQTAEWEWHTWLKYNYLSGYTSKWHSNRARILLQATISRRRRIYRALHVWSTLPQWLKQIDRVQNCTTFHIWIYRWIICVSGAYDISYENTGIHFQESRNNDAWPGIGVMLCQRHRRRANIESTLG